MIDRRELVLGAAALSLGACAGGSAAQVATPSAPTQWKKPCDRALPEQAGRHPFRLAGGRLVRQRRGQALSHDRRRRDVGEGVGQARHIHPRAGVRGHRERFSRQCRDGLLSQRHRHTAALPHARRGTLMDADRGGRRGLDEGRLRHRYMRAGAPRGGASRRTAGYPAISGGRPKIWRSSSARIDP